MIEPAKAKVPSRSPEALSHARERRLLAYTLAVGAGLAAAPELADASIVYTNPPDSSITNDGESIPINLDNSGPIDLSVFIDRFGETGEAFEQLRVGGFGQPTSVMGTGNASALSAGATIDSAQTFQSIQFLTRLMAGAYFNNYGEYGTYGPWAPNSQGRFLGVTFQIAGEAHFGWARFNVFTEAGSSFADVGATRLDYAYESCPREGITAGATTGGASCGPSVPLPPSLGLLALGAAGLGFWRLRKN